MSKLKAKSGADSKDLSSKIEAQKLRDAEATESYILRLQKRGIPVEEAREVAEIWSDARASAEVLSR